MTSTPAPSVDRRRLRTILRREREKAQMTQDQVAIAMDWSLSKIIRIESGIVNISTNDLRALLDLYAVATTTKDELIELARAARRPPWWAEYRDSMSPQLVSYIGLEPHAAELHFFHNTLIPGILQTRAYAYAAIHGSAPEALDPAVADLQLEVRVRRQAEFFDQPSPPRLVVVLDEAAIRRQVGGPATLAKQLNHLIDLSHRPDVTIRIIPFTHGAHAGAFGPYIIMDFADPQSEPSVLFTEGASEEGMVREKPEVIDVYRRSFDQLSDSSLDPVKSIEFIGRVRDELWR
jgi:transcriptional regulator with XRE-family HTH domain